MFQLNEDGLQFSKSNQVSFFLAVNPHIQYFYFSLKHLKNINPCDCHGNHSHSTWLIDIISKKAPNLPPRPNRNAQLNKLEGK